jgi:hypothetical protein
MYVCAAANQSIHIVNMNQLPPTTYYNAQLTHTHTHQKKHTHHFALALPWILYQQDLQLPSRLACFLAFSRSNTYRTIRYPMAIRSNASRFTHFAFAEDEMSYEPRTAWTPGILLICPTAKDVPTYSFSTKPCKCASHVTSSSQSTHTHTHK